MTIERSRKPGGLRGSGSNKIRRKQREYQAHVHAMLAAGKVNNSAGSWVDISSAGLDGKVSQRASRQAERFGGGK